MTQPPAARLLALFDQGIEQADALLAALRDEHAALQQRSAAAIETALTLKTERLTAFEDTEAERRRLLDSLQVPDRRDAVLAFLAAQAEQAPALTGRWTRLLEIADACRGQNRLNGALVETQRRHVQRALDILRGAPEATTYGPGGAPDTRGGSHTLAKA